MSNSLGVIKKLQNVLQTCSDLNFVKTVFVGARNNVIETPSISIIPESETEETDTLPVIRISLDIKLYGINKIFDDDKVFVSDETSDSIGILAFANAVKKTLDNNNTLDNTVINIKKGICKYGYDKSNIFFELPITVEYRTKDKIRN